MDIRKVVLVYPVREGRILGRASGAPYTLMRLASLVPDNIPVEIWDESLEPLDPKLATLGPNDLLGITAKTLVIESARDPGRTICWVLPPRRWSLNLPSAWPASPAPPACGRWWSAGRMRP